jgi:hypothetical protein
MSSFVTLSGVELFKPGRYRDCHYDDHAVSQILTAMRMLVRDPEGARILGLGTTPRIAVVMNHDPVEHIGVLDELTIDDRDVLIGKLGVARYVAADIAAGKIDGVSVAIGCAAGIYYLRHIALVRFPAKPYVQGLKPLKECLPMEYVK